MSTITLTPSSDRLVQSGWSKNGFSGTYSAALSDANDSTFASISSNLGNNPNGTLELNLSSIPGTVTAMSAVPNRGCAAKLSSNREGSSDFGVAVGNATSIFQLASEITVTPTASFTTITTSATLNDSTIADWSSAFLF